MSVSDLDRLYLRVAVELGERGLYTVTRNNPRVGCVIVKDGAVVGRGWHKADGGPHAEIEALGSVAGETKGATAYVSLEPCCWEGRTPACTEALTAAGIARVVIAARDPHPRVSGGGVDALEKAGVEVAQIELPEALALNPGHRSRLERGRPWIRIKVACSIDGRTAMASGESQWITGPEARADVQHWRARSAAIVTGVGTVLADDPQLTVRDPRFEGLPPLRVVADSLLRTPADAALFQSSGRVIVVCGTNPETDAVSCLAHAELWRQRGSRVDAGELVARLADEGCNEVLVEAGPTLVASFVDQGLWDELIVYMAPKLLGQSARPMAALDLSRMVDGVVGRIASSERVGADLKVVLVPESNH